MKISLLIPSYNEEQTIKACVLSCLEQEKPFDQIVVVDDGSTDGTKAVLEQFKGVVEVVSTGINTGNKSRAQEYGMQYITGDVVVMTDADTLLSPGFSTAVAAEFLENEADVVVGYVKSVQHNWLTALREIDYLIGQDVYKKAQAHLRSILVVSGCAAAFKTSLFFEHVITFDHDTLTEDLDFTYKAHAHRLNVRHSTEAVVYTQDPNTMYAYVNQMRRWVGGGVENIIKHWRTIVSRPKLFFEVGLMYGDSVLFMAVLVSLVTAPWGILTQFLFMYIVLTLVVGVYSCLQRSRYDLLVYAPLFFVLNLINLYILIEQVCVVGVLRRRQMIWFKPNRRKFV